MNLGLTFKNWTNDWITCQDGLLFGSDRLQTSHISGPTSELFQQLRTKTGWLLKPAVTFTKSRPVAAHRRKQALTKTDGGGCRGGRARAGGGLDGSIHQPAAFPFPDRRSGRHRAPRARRPPTIYLTAEGGEADGSGPAFDESVCVGVCRLSPFRWGHETNMSTYQTFLLNFSTGGK